LRLKAASAAKDRRAGMVIAVFVSPLPDISDQVQNAKVAGT
jgi:hypothetical protein